jgi:hypothetical protein
MKKITIIATMLLFVCCSEAEATNNTTNEVIKPVVRKVYTHPVEINLDDMTFTNAFRVQYLAKGEGSTFWWRNNEYTTNLAQITVKPDEFVVKHTELDVETVGWVRNNDDPNDECRSNVLDDCGVCNGPGKVTWFRDKDGDGLGTFMEWITSCTFPTDMEIEKYQHESLLEGGGDQGR